MKTKPTFYTLISLPRLVFGLAALALGVFALSTARAQNQTLTWNNGKSNRLWDTNKLDTNWVGNKYWTNATTQPDSAIFGSTGVGTVTVTNNVDVSNITFNTTGYTITSSPNNSNVALVLTGASSTITNAAGTSNTISACIGGTTKGLIIEGTGILKLNFTNNTYGGGTTVNAGTLDLGPGATNNAATIVGTLTINAGATVNADENNSLGYAQLDNNKPMVSNIVINGGTLNFTGGTSQGTDGNITMENGGILSSSASGNHHLNRTGTATGPPWNEYALFISNNASSQSCVINCNLELECGASPGLLYDDLWITVAQGTCTNGIDLLDTGTIGDPGTGGILKMGPGTLRLDGSNNLVSVVGDMLTISNGTVLIDNPNAGFPSGIDVYGGALGGVGTISGPVTVGPGGTLEAGTNLTGFNSLSLTNGFGTLTLTNGLTLSASPASTNFMRYSVTGGIVTNDALALTTGTLTYAGVLTVSNATSDGRYNYPGYTFVLFPKPPGGYAGSFAVTNLTVTRPSLVWSNSLNQNGALQILGIPVFTLSSLTATQSIIAGASNLTLIGAVYWTNSGSTAFPAQGETVTVTIDNYSQSTTTSDNTGDFSINFTNNLANIPASTTPYQITYSYPGDSKLTGATNSTSSTLTVGIGYYVSPGGANGAGTQSSPFNSFSNAQYAIHTLRVAAGQYPPEWAAICVADGTFYMTNSLTLTSNDDNLVIEGLPTASPRLCGGLPLQPSNFSLVTSNSPVWSRLAPSAQGVVLEVNLAAYGITSLPPMIMDEYQSANASAPGPFPSAFYCNDQVQQLGRWPSNNPNFNAYSNWAALVTVPATNQFTYSGTEPSRWTEAPDPWYHGLWSSLEDQNILPGSSINTTNSTISLSNWPSDISVTIKAGAPWYAYNLLEEITGPGEYYIDRANQILYFWPPANFSTADLFVSQLDGPLINATNGASNIVISGLELSGGRGDLLDTDSTCANIQFCDGRLMGAGRHGAQLNGFSNSITGCEIGFASGNGVLLEGGDVATLTPGGNAVSNCIIHDWGQMTWAVISAVQTLGTSCGNDIVHNQIYNGNGAGVLFWGNNHRIAFNVISNVCRWNVDYGAIYAADPWVGYGNAIQDNFIYNIYGGWPGTTFYTNNPIGVNAIYLDNCKSGTDVSSNVIYMVSQIGIYENGGRDNIMSNNVIVHCKVMHNGSDLGLSEVKWGPGGGSINLLQDLTNLNYQGTPWSTAYPLLAAIPDSYSTISNYYAPSNVVFACNLGYTNTNSYVNQVYESVATFSCYASFTNNLTNSDPLFVDEANLNLTLETNSPAYTQMTNTGVFGAIPFLAIGVATPAVANVQTYAAPTGYAGVQALINPMLDTNNCQAYVYYGTVDCGRTTDGWQGVTTSQAVSAIATYQFQFPTNGVSTYYARIVAANQSGYSWGSWSQGPVVIPPP